MLKLIRALGFMTSLITALLLGTALLYLLQEQMIFHPTSVSEQALSRLKEHEVHLERGPVVLQGWLLRGRKFDTGPIILYFGGNAEEVSANLYDLEGFGTDSFLFVNYRGYGASSGEPSQKALFGDALFVFDWLVKTQGINPLQIVAMGRSLGAGVATYLASQRPLRGVVLVSPYDSLLALGQHHYPYLPVRWLLRHRFEVAEMAPYIHTPLLALIGEQDRIIPPSRSDALVARWGGPAQVVRLPGAGHNDLGLNPLYRQSIQGFVSSPAPGH